MYVHYAGLYPALYNPQNPIIMADCKFLSGNALVSGTLKREVYYVDGVKHIRRLEARVTRSGKQKIYIRHDTPSCRKPSSNMTMAMSRFTMASRIVNNMPQDEKMQYHKEWKAAKFKFNGKEYATLRGYIIARLYAEKVV